MGEEFSSSQSFLFGVDTSDPMLAVSQNATEYQWFSNTLNDMMPLLTDKYGTNDLQAVISERAENDTMVFGTFGFKVIMDSLMLLRKDGVCLVLKESEDTFYAIINGCTLKPFSADPQNPYMDYLVVEDGKFVDGKWVRNRRLNGDQVTITTYNEPTLLKVQLFAYH